MKPPLEFEKNTHTYRRPDGLVVPSVTSILKSVGAYKNANFFTEDGQNRGTAVHTIAERVFKKEIVEYQGDEELAGYAAALLEFFQEDLFETVFVERQVYCRELGYCGTVDLIARKKSNNQVCIIDVKSGAPDGATALQLGGYAYAYELAETKDIGLYALHVKSSSKYKLIDYRESNPGLVEDWLAAVRFYQWRKCHGKFV